MSMECEHIGTCTLYRDDCLALLPYLQADALISDPPYGIGYDTRKKRGHGRGLKGSSYSNIPWATLINGDDHPFAPVPWLRFPQVILWGAQNYAAALPNSNAWLIWDKRVGSTPDDFGDCEMAWTNLRGVSRIHRQLWRGICRTGEDNPTHHHKLHPAQKPIELMRWCVAKTQGVVLDPYAGSFTTGLACLEVGRPFIGVEIEQEYFDLGCQRLEKASRQGHMFLPSVAQHAPLNMPLFGGDGP